MGMTIDEAIGLLSDALNEPLLKHSYEYDKASKLGIEALKWIGDARDYLEWTVPALLPGETEK
jgi:hypothetical protein